MSANPQTEISEKQSLQARLDEGRMLWLGSLKDVSEEDAKFSPGEGLWNILEVAEHVAVSERQMLSLWRKLAVAGSSPREKDHVLLGKLGDRNTKNPAPEPSKPSRRFTLLKDAEAAFLEYRESTLETLRNAEGLRDKVVEHPLAGTVDGYQLFLIMALHPLRHAQQVEEIKNHPAYPRSKK